VPSVTVPHVSDQFGFANELQRLGVAPAPIHRTKLTAARLASRLKQVLGNQQMKQAAVAMAERMRSDRGAERAAELIEAAVGPPTHAS
jgi:sterol 3beta-glucosyltransferase